LAQNKKPLTPAQIKAAFYKQHGKDLNVAVQNVFGKDASKVPAQTLADSPKLDTSKSRADLSAMGNGEPTEARNRPNSDTYQAKDGIIFIPTETVASGNMNAISGDYAHELGNLLKGKTFEFETSLQGTPFDWRLTPKKGNASGLLHGTDRRPGKGGQGGEMVIEEHVVKKL
jgi:hypothetical protein